MVIIFISCHISIYVDKLIGGWFYWFKVSALRSGSLVQLVWHVRVVLLIDQFKKLNQLNQLNERGYSIQSMKLIQETMVQFHDRCSLQG